MKSAHSPAAVPQPSGILSALLDRERTVLEQREGEPKFQGCLMDSGRLCDNCDSVHYKQYLFCLHQLQSAFCWIQIMARAIVACTLTLLPRSPSYDQWRLLKGYLCKCSAS